MKQSYYQEEYIRGSNILHLAEKISGTPEREIDPEEVSLEDFFSAESLAGFPFVEEVREEVETGYPLQKPSDVYRLFAKITDTAPEKIARLFLNLCRYKVMEPQAFYAAAFTAYVCYEMDYRLLTGDMQNIEKELAELREEERLCGFSEEIGNLFQKYEMALLELASECRLKGIQILPPDINLSDPYEFRCEEEGIRIPFDFPYHEMFWPDVDRLCKRRREKPFMRLEEVEELLPEQSVQYLQSNRSLDSVSEVHSGMKELDEALGGFLPGRLYVLAGRPSIGKTTFLRKLAESIRKTQLKEVGYYCFKDHPWIPEEDHINVFEIGEDFLELEMTLRKRQRQGIIIIDGFEYVNPLLNPVACAPLNRVEVIRRLKQVALDRGVPVIVTFTVSRSVEARADHHPKIRDIPGIQEGLTYVDGIMALYREGYYVPNSKAPMELEIIKNPGREATTMRLPG